MHWLHQNATWWGALKSSSKGHLWADRSCSPLHWDSRASESYNPSYPDGFKKEKCVLTTETGATVVLEGLFKRKCPGCKTLVMKLLLSDDCAQIPDCLEAKINSDHISSGSCIQGLFLDGLGCWDSSWSNFEWKARQFNSRCPIYNVILQTWTCRWGLSRI